jgi:hypothetical protein
VSLEPVRAQPLTVQRWLAGLWQRRGIPLSLLLLTRQPVRLAVALAGISFAGILMFMQLGFATACLMPASPFIGCLMPIWC